jgi:ribonuclease HI
LGWWISTDGFGQVLRDGERVEKRAGWGVIVFRNNGGPDTLSMLPDFVLHAPVVTQAWDHRWIGAREATNNTAELSAIGEAMLWLRDEAPDEGWAPLHIRYDSEYAANIARGTWAALSNEELAETVRNSVREIGLKRVMSWEHVYGQSGAHDNELADRAADLGCQGKVSLYSQ